MNKMTWLVFMSTELAPKPYLERFVLLNMLDSLAECPLHSIYALMCTFVRKNVVKVAAVICCIPLINLTYNSPLNILTAFWAITWRHPATTNPVSSKFFIVLDETFAALKRLVPHMPVTCKMYMKSTSTNATYIIIFIPNNFKVIVNFTISCNEHSFIIRVSYTPIHSNKTCTLEKMFT